MTFGFESGIKNFYERRQVLFKESNIHGTFDQRIKDLKARMKSKSHDTPTICILGAGPAGLLRAIQSVCNGNPTKVIEKRSEVAPGRTNTVALSRTTITMLEYCGIYQYLMEHNLIYPPNEGNYITVRLADLEYAMKYVLKLLNPDSVIQYDCKVTKIDSQSNKIIIEMDHLNDSKSTLANIDILVNAEGSRSSSNSLLGIKRTEVLPPIPVIAAVFKDKRSTITGVGSLLRYAGKSVVYLAMTINYHIQFLFGFIVSKKFRNQFTGALILKTPQQNYVGCGFSDQINSRLSVLQGRVTTKKAAAAELKTNQSKKELETAEKKYKEFAKRWINLSLCHANLSSIVSRMLGGPHFHSACNRTLVNFDVIKIGADKANLFSKKIGDAFVLLTGDASATVDPVTGLGCNTAIQSSVDFLDFIYDYDAKINRDTLIHDYNEKTEERISYIHRMSRIVRTQYRPDALEPQMIMMMQ